MNQDDGSLLPIGARVDQYDIIGHLGHGGFGITYKVHDPKLDTVLALKEFFPSNLVARQGQALRHTGHGKSNADFEWSRRKFYNEARLLAQLDHPNIVKVRRVFEANNTAYMLLDFIPGSTLEGWLDNLDSAPTQEELDLIAGPLLDALELVHRSGTWHLDVSPDNILIRSTDGAPILVDFGAARLEITQRSHLLSAMLVKSGYSPPEQYSPEGVSYGPWTDIYAAGATLYRAISGQRPVASVSRSLKDELTPARQIGKVRYRDGFLRAVDAALRLQPQARPRTVAAWRAALLDINAPRPAVTLLTSRIGPETEIVRSGAWSSIRDAVLDVTPALTEIVRRQARNIWEALGTMPRRVLALTLVPVVLVALVGLDWWTSGSTVSMTSQVPSGARQLDRPPRVEPPIASASTISKRAGRVLTLPVRLGSLETDDQTGWLAANLADVGNDLTRCFSLFRASGAFVAEVGTGGAAARSGILPGDIVFSFNGTLIENVSDLRRRVQELSAGADVRLDVWRAGEEGQDFADVLRAYAAEGDGYAMNLLGTLYKNGTTVPRNNVEAVTWFRKGVEANDAAAMVSLSEMMIAGRGTAKDVSGAAKQLTAAAKLSHNDAMARFIRLIIEARPKDDMTRKISFARQLAEEGSPAGMVLFGDLHVAGLGVKRDYAEGLRWYRKAADQGDPAAINSVGVVYAEGQGVPKDAKESLVWFRKAALLGDLAALRNIAYALDNGLGIDRDADKAAHLVFLSLASGREESYTDLQRASTPWSKDFRIALQRRMQSTGLYSGPTDGELASTMAAMKTLVDRRPRVPSNI